MKQNTDGPHGLFLKIKLVILIMTKQYRPRFNRVCNNLFPYLSFKNKIDDFNTIEFKIGIIFSELKNKIQDGYILRKVLNEVGPQFKSDAQKHELSLHMKVKFKIWVMQVGRVGNITLQDH